eukprot:g47117.t1
MPAGILRYGPTVQGDKLRKKREAEKKVNYTEWRYRVIWIKFRNMCDSMISYSRSRLIKFYVTATQTKETDVMNSCSDAGSYESGWRTANQAYFGTGILIEIRYRFRALLYKWKLR